MPYNDDVVNSLTSNINPKCVWTEQKSFTVQKGKTYRTGRENRQIHN